MMNNALFPGSFDPPTFGHIDMIARACSTFGKVVVGIGINHRKKGIFTCEERKHLLLEAIKSESWADEVTVECFSGLLIDFARQKQIRTVVRGLRQVSDFEYEFRMSLTNRRLAPEIETVFFMPDESHSFVSATLVKEVALWGGDLNTFVPDNVAKALRKKMELREKNP